MHPCYSYKWMGQRSGRLEDLCLNSCFVRGRFGMAWLLPWLVFRWLVHRDTGQYSTYSGDSFKVPSHPLKRTASEGHGWLVALIEPAPTLQGDPFTLPQKGHLGLMRGLTSIGRGRAGHCGRCLRSLPTTTTASVCSWTSSYSNSQRNLFRLQ